MSTPLILPKLFSDHMVLQRDQVVPIWGTAAPGAKITVTFREQEKTTSADADGKWSVKLDPLSLGEPAELKVNTVTIKDVLVGEVWLGSGQSNMAAGYPGNDTSPTATVLPLPTIRLFGGAWKAATASTCAGFSAIMVHFGVRLHQELHVPIGLLCGAQGGTSSGPWVPEDDFNEDPTCKAVAKQLSRPALTVTRGKLGECYEQHIRRLVGYGIRGVVWDQGEGGAGLEEIDQYTMMTILIRSWRKAWGQGDFPFLYVQKPSGLGCAWDDSNPVTALGERFTALPKAVPRTILGEVDQGSGLTGHGLYRPMKNMLGTGDGPSGMTRDDAIACLKLMDFPNTGMAISSDLGAGLHPQNKFGYGNRVAQVALGKVYGRQLEYYGPVYASHQVDGNTMRVKFTHIGQGLAFRHGEHLQGFAVAGSDKSFQWADAVIVGDTVVVTGRDVAQPKFVRYAWSHNRQWANLFNKDGLPAVPFRTDGDD
ncbi:9-O-acetylesterase [Planctomycetota bacterium]|nr:9-O-acetylesterase [Planctomycetota bacterium]